MGVVAVGELAPLAEPPAAAALALPARNALAELLALVLALDALLPSPLVRAALALGLVVGEREGGGVPLLDPVGDAALVCVGVGAAAALPD